MELQGYCFFSRDAFICFCFFQVYVLLFFFVAGVTSDQELSLSLKMNNFITFTTF